MEGGESEGWAWKAVFRHSMNHHTEKSSLSGWLLLKEIYFIWNGMILTNICTTKLGEVITWHSAVSITMKNTWKLICINLIHPDVGKVVNALGGFLMCLVSAHYFLLSQYKQHLASDFQKSLLMAGEPPTMWKGQRENHFLVLARDSKKPAPQNVAYMEQEPCKCSAFKTQIYRRLIVSFFWNSQHRNSRSHMEKGSDSHKNRQIWLLRFLFMQLSQPRNSNRSEQKYSPPGHWDVGLQWRKTSQGAEEAAAPIKAQELG